MKKQFILSITWLLCASVCPFNLAYPLTIFSTAKPSGLYYKEKLSNGTVRHVVEKNIVILVQKPIPLPDHADEKTVDKINRKNRLLASSNQARLEQLKEVEKYFNGDPEHPATNSADEVVYFKFNIIEVPVEHTECLQSARALIYKYGLPSALTTASGCSIPAPATVLTTYFTPGVFGQTFGYVVCKPALNAPDGTLAHEIGHTLGLIDSYGRGNGNAWGTGLMGAKPGLITKEEVDQILLKCLKRDK